MAVPRGLSYESTLTESMTRQETVYKGGLTCQREQGRNARMLVQLSYRPEMFPTKVGLHTFDGRKNIKPQEVDTAKHLASFNLKVDGVYSFTVGRYTTAEWWIVVTINNTTNLVPLTIGRAYQIINSGCKAADIRKVYQDVMLER